MRLAPQLVLVLTALASVLALAAPASAFQTSWTDQYGETAYKISGPDDAPPLLPYDVVLTVTDALYPNDWVASSWSLKEDGISKGSGFSLYTTGGSWTKTYTFSWPTAGIHTYTFRAQDQGHGGGGHGYAWMEISGVVTVGSATPVVSSTWGRIKALYAVR